MASWLSHLLVYITIDVETFAGLNISGFSPMKFFAEILSWCTDHQYSLLTVPIGKNSQENFRSKLKNHEKHKI